MGITDGPSGGAAGSTWGNASHVAIWTLGPLDPRVQVAGGPEELDSIFAVVRPTVAPLRSGAGTKGRVLDSFAAGLPCVMRGTAAEGLPLDATR